MTTVEFLAQLQDLGIKLWAEGDRLRYRGSKESLTPALLAELAARKTDLLGLLRAAAPSSSIPRAALNGPPPLSFAQQRLWFLDQLLPNTATYNLPTALRLSGTLDVAALSATMSAIIGRHQVLRTIFVRPAGAPNSDPIQRILPPPSAETPHALPVVDLQTLPSAEREAAAQRLIAEELERTFDLEQGPLLRTTLLRLSPTEHILLVTLHHIIGDGWSLSVLVQEVAALYPALAQGAAPSLPELPIQYTDFAIWQRQQLQGEVLDRELAYWREQLANVPPLLELPTDRPRPAMQTFGGATQSFTLVEHAAALKAVSEREGATLFMTLLAAFDVLLHRHTGQSDIVVGSPIANRTRAELEGLIGFFVNTLVLRADLAGNPRFCDLLQQVRRVTLDAYAHQEIPFEKLVEVLQPQRDMRHTPFFQVMFALQNAPVSALELPDVVLSHVPLTTTSAKFDLTVAVVESDAALLVDVEYNTDLFEAATIARMVEHWRTLLAAISADPAARIGDLPLLTDAEQQQIVHDWNSTTTDYPASATVHELFEAQAARTPDAVAVAYGERQISYAALNQRANALARTLRTMDVGPETLVGLCVERSIELIVGFLGILKAGAAYVPLDPSYPQERLRFMLEDTAATVVVAQPSLAASLPEAGARLVLLDADQSTVTAADAHNQPSGTAATNLAYVIYTSGSTGTPKGAAVTHQAITRLVCNTDYVQLSPDDRIAQVSNAAFDAITFEAWGALLHGGMLVGVAQEIALTPHALIAHLREHQITTMFMTTALFNQLARADGRAFSSLRSVLFGGEAVDPRWVREVLQAGPPERLLHVYGPTETTTFATAYLVDEVSADAATVPIGRPIRNTTLYVLDGRLQPVPVGVPGELYIGGPGLARGYLNRPALTAERFVAHPLSSEPGARLYKTGDLVRLRPDGAVEFLGRIDQQIKLRGFRVELGEIEQALGEHPAIAEACVVLSTSAQTGDKRLVAYVVAEPRTGDGEPRTKNQEPGSSDLRDFLKQRLPDYMIPSAFVHLDALPLTPNGKVDRRALPAADEIERVVDQPYAAPRTPTEALLAELWADVLGVAQVGLDDNFFELGGHSLLATQLISRARDAFNTDVSLRDLFETLTVASLAELIDSARRQQTASPPVTPVERGQPLPLSFSQQRFWFLDQLLPDSPAYTITLAVRLRGTLNQRALERSLDALVARHESLRTIFGQQSEASADEISGPVQIILPAVETTLPLIELSATSEEERAQQIEALLVAEAARPFDLRHGPLLRTTLVRHGPQEHALLLAVHHIIIDGWSMNLLVRELATLYRSFSQGDSAAEVLPPLPVQYADYAIWQREWFQGDVLAAEMDYWRQQLRPEGSGPLPVLELPLDHPRPALQSVRGAVETRVLPSDLTDALKALSRAEGATLFMTLLAAFDVLLHRYTGQTDLLIGTPTAGRVRPELEGLVGLFLNTLVIRADVSGDPTFRALLAQVRDTTLTAFDHQTLPFERLVEELQPDRNLSHTPVFQVMFNMLNFANITLELPGVQMSIAEPPPPAQFDLTLTVAESPAGLIVAFTYNADLFEAATIARMAAQFEILLRGIAADPSLPITRLPLLTADERGQMLHAWNDTRLSYAAPPCLHELFEAQVIRTPNAIAVTSAAGQLSYQELDARANQLARYLRAQGVGPDVRVGLCVERSTDLVVAILGVLKSGGAYVPLDPAYPRDRLAFMLADAQATVLVTQESLLATLPATSAAIICLDRDRALIERAPEQPAVGSGLAAALAYVIYTSGSTGQPKGVAITHENAVALIAWAQTVFTPDEVQGVLASTSVCFDLSIFELFVPLSVGGRVILVENALQLAALAPDAGVTLVNTVPSVMTELLRLNDLPDSVRVVNLAGEPLPLQLAQQLYQQPQVAQVYNLYGPSEDTTYSTYARIPSDSSAAPAIGEPISNTQAYVLDAQMEPVPIGVAGELYLGGAGLARGYLNRPALTAERFVPDPFSSQTGARLYRTGDLVRRRAHGALEFVTRLDHQIKLRGFRIEIGEIEHALAQHPAVRAAVVLLRSDPQPRLVAYVVSHAEQPVDPAELRSFASAHLPDYMLPSVIMPLPALPLTPNGKLDRRALPAPEPVQSDPQADYVAPRTATEHALAELWAEVLGVERVGIHHHFFEMGGHSMLALHMIARLRQTMQVELPVRTLFTTPTIATLAQHIDVMQWAASSRAAVMQPAESSEEGEL